MNRGVTTGGGTAALPQEKSVIHRADDDGATGPGNLGMTSQTEISISLDEQLFVHRTVGFVAGSASFPQSFMLEDKLSGLFTMALGA